MRHNEAIGGKYNKGDMLTMKSFVKLKKGDKVFSKNLQSKGVIVEIDSTSATFKQDDTDTLHVSPLFDLVKLDEVLDEKYDYNKWFHQVTEFHKAFDHPVADKPTSLDLERTVSRQVWTAEELIEHLQSSSKNEEEFLKAYEKFLEGIEKAKDKSLKDDYPQTEEDKLVAQADALVDALYFILGSFTELGVEPDKLFDIVQSANMSKLFTAEDGTKYAKYRESDGKILKSPEFFEPEPLLKEEILRQLNK